MQKFVALLVRGEKAFVVALFAAMTLSSIFQVINRNILHLTIGWTEEVARFCQVWLALLGTQIGLRIGGQMSITVLTARLKGAHRRLVAVVADLTVLVFCGVVFWYSLDLMRVQIRSWQLSPALKLPMVVPYAAMVFCFGAMCAGQLHSMYRHLSPRAETAPGS